MNEPIVNVLPFGPRGCPAGIVGRTRRMPLGDALAQHWGGDAHFQALRPGERLRVATKQIGEVEIVMTCAAFDLDFDGHAEPPESWRRQTVTRCTAALQGRAGHHYPTRHGHRLIWALDEPVTIASTQDAKAWRERYLTTAAELERDHGLRADRSCSDFARCYRLPLVVRGESRPQANTHPHSGAKHRQQAYQPDPDWPEAHGELHRQLQAIGAVNEQLDATASWIVCPFAHAHSTPASRGDCVLFDRFDSWGWIDCKHSSCAERSQDDFRESVAAAYVAAGHGPSGQSVECVSAFAGLPADPSDADLLALRLGGRDDFSRMRLRELRARCDIPELRDHSYELQALRWCARGLDAPLTVRWAVAMAAAYPR